ncbi:hypothetical protein YC2023_005130 [Brassica napus]
MILRGSSFCVQAECFLANLQDFNRVCDCFEADQNRDRDLLAGLYRESPLSNPLESFPTP